MQRSKDSSSRHSSHRTDSNSKNRHSRDKPRHSDSEEEDRTNQQELLNQKRQRRSSNSSEENNSEERHDRTRRPAKHQSDSESESNQRSNPKKADDCAELFVRNLPWKADEEVISDYFSKFGKVVNVKVLYDKQTGKAKGLGFVEFSSKDEAESVVNQASSLELDGRNLQVSFSNQRDARPARDNEGGNREFVRRENTSGPSNTVFVGNLSFQTNEDTIRDFFDECGSIVDVRMAKTPEGKSKGFCHIEFEAAEASEKALKKAGENVDGRDIRVDFSSQKQGGGSFRGGFNRDRGDRGGFSRGGSSKLYFL